ncbi:MAG: pre-peptidase C-terminal domain-containing protein [Gemmataceae bacterium]|nr:pre-peptidase C-terminal domain-containing protein [Gemmataceae bacterium]
MRRRRTFQVERLESRLAPAASLMGPLSHLDQVAARDTGADLWAGLGLTSRSAVTRLDLPALVERLATAPREYDPAPVEIALPRPDGSFARFRVWEIERSPELAAAMPTTHMYRGQGIDRPADLLAADITTTGFHARVLGPGTLWSIDPEQANYTSSLPELTPGHATGCGCADCSAVLSRLINAETIVSAGGEGGTSGGGIITGGSPQESTGTQLRSYRFVVASTGEYTAYSGGVANTQANIVTLTNRLNLVLERDYSARLTLIPNASIVYTNSATDPYTGDNAFSMVEENITNLTNVVGNANYDIGHVFSSQSFGGGVGYYKGIGQNWRAGGATICGTFTTPTGLPFESNFIHEVGHQFGGLHTFNGVAGAAAFNRNGPTAVEVGSGSSIMAYPGICDTDDLQAAPDLYFHSLTYDDTQDFLSTLTGVGTTTPTGNTPPVVFAGNDAVIPANTPFALTATASDINGDTLTYSWEERDLGAAQALGAGDNGTSPLFRAFAPVSSPTRTFPNLTNLVAGTASKGETLPTTDRNLTFRVMVRDNRTGGGGVTLDDLSLRVVNTGSAFAVTSPNTATSWPASSTQLVTWNVAGTDGGAINAPLVNIRLSIDGGLTYSALLASNTPNDGSEPVVVPVGAPSTQCRIKVEPVGNYFFDISDVNFAITASPAMRVTATNPVTGGVLGTTLDVTFSQPINAATLSTSDITLSQGSVTAVTLQSASVARYTLAGLSGEGAVTVTMPAGAVASTTGNGTAQFIGNYVLDVTTSAFPTPLVASGPLGSMTYCGTAAGAISLFVAAPDTDSYTITLDAGQTLSLTATPGATLRPTVQITGPGGVNVSNTAATAGQSATLSAVATTSAGTYTITVGGAGSTVGSYALRLDLNSAIEAEPNNSQATATPIGGSSFALGGTATRLALRGRLESPAESLPNEIEANNSVATANDATQSFTPYTGNLYQLGFGTTIDYDFFKLGNFQPGDLITQAQYGAGSGRGTQAEPVVYFYYNTGGYYLGYDDNSGPGNDSLFYRYNVDVDDVYFGNASGFYFFGDTIQMGYLLENAGTPPLTGGSFVDTEPNQTAATATDVSNAWRAVNYRSVVAGTVSSGSDSDFVKYQFNAGDLVTFQVHSTSDLDAAVVLRNPAGTVIASDPGDGGGLVPEEDAFIYAYVIPTTGTYTVEVKAATGTGGSYTLTSLLSASAAPPAPADCASFTLAAGQSATVALKGLAAGTINFDVLNPGGSVVASGTAGPTNYDKSATFTAAGAGTYAVRVQGTAGLDYVVTITSGATVDAEQNDATGTAQALVSSRAAGGITAGDEDWYSFAATAGQLITLATATPAGGAGEFVNALAPLVEIYSPANTLIGSGGATALAQATSTGTYRVRVRGSGGSTGEYVLAQSAVVDAPAKVSSLIVGDGTTQRSRVTKIDVVFNEPVTAPAGAFGLSRQSDSAAVALAAATSGNTVTLTFTGGPIEFGSLADGRYTLTINAASVTDSAGQPLDGNGDGTFGDNYTLVGTPANGLFRLFGDGDGSGQVTSTDFLAFRLAFLGTVPTFDFNNSGSVDSSDFLAFRLRFLQSV